MIFPKSIRENIAVKVWIKTLYYRFFTKIVITYVNLMIEVTAWKIGKQKIKWYCITIQKSLNHINASMYCKIQFCELLDLHSNESRKILWNSYQLWICGVESILLTNWSFINSFKFLEISRKQRSGTFRLMSYIFYYS